MKNKSKQEILADISKKELGQYLDEYIKFFEYWYDGVGDYYDFDGYHHQDYFYDWLENPIRNRDEKIDEILGISKNMTIGDYMNKKLDNK